MAAVGMAAGAWASVIPTRPGRPGNLVSLAAEIAQLPGVRAARTGVEEPFDEE